VKRRTRPDTRASTTNDLNPLGLVRNPNPMTLSSRMKPGFAALTSVSVIVVRIPNRMIYCLHKCVCRRHVDKISEGSGDQSSRLGLLRLDFVGIAGLKAVQESLRNPTREKF
jgi:hypothetical protein